MTSCPRCQTEMIVKGGHPDFEGDLEGQTMHYACPVCQGTPDEFIREWSGEDVRGIAKFIAARDAAKKAEGRLEGLKEAAGICEAVYESDDKARHDSMYLQGFEWGAEKCEQAIRAAMEAE